MNNEDIVAEQYLAEAELGRYSLEKIKNVNGRIRTYGLVTHGVGVVALAVMAVNSYFHGDYGTASLMTVLELPFTTATYLFERATRPKK